ncbi:hypothetical protein O988_09759 [Pseudogymnoascus sp. VKM F-3808]|nr:hypothetical protein O988_09759 [Pseudogymnoascus sp. VKM F-3808]
MACQALVKGEVRIAEAVSEEARVTRLWANIEEPEALSLQMMYGLHNDAVDPLLGCDGAVEYVARAQPQFADFAGVERLATTTVVLWGHMLNLSPYHAYNFFLMVILTVQAPLENTRALLSQHTTCVEQEALRRYSTALQARLPDRRAYIALTLPSFEQVTIILVSRPFTPTNPSQRPLNLNETFDILQLELDPTTTKAVLGQNYYNS